MIRQSVRIDALIAFLTLTVFWAASLRAADPSPAKLTLQIEDLGLLGGLGGGSPARSLPLAGMVIPPEEADKAAALQRLQAPGFVDAAGALTDKGRAVWRCLSRPELAVQVRRTTAGSIGSLWYLAGPEQAWCLAAGKDFTYELLGPLARAGLAEVVASSLRLPPPAQTSGIRETFTLTDFMILQTISREMVVFAALEGFERGKRPALGLTLDEIANYLLIPTRLESLASDPSIDLMEQWPALTDPAQLRPVVEGLIARGWLAETRSSQSTRYEFTERGRLLEGSVMNARFIQIAVLRFNGEAFTAASAHICISREQLTTVVYRPGRQEFSIDSLPPGEVRPAVAALIGGLIDEVGRRSVTTSGPASRSATSAPAALAATTRPTTSPSSSLGDEVYEELVRGVFRTGAAQKSHEIWGRGKPDLWAVDTGKDGVPDIEYEDSDGDDEPDFVRVRDLPDRPFTRSFIRMKDGWQESNILEVFLEVNFKLPWAREMYHKHNVNVVMNDQVVAQLIDVIPEGRYRFRLRPQVVRVNALGAEKNTLRLETSHLRGGHYVVSTDFRLIMKLSQVSRHVVAENEIEAGRILMEQGNLVISGVDPSIYVNEWRIEPPAPRGGESATIRGLVHNDGEEKATGWKLRFYEGDPAKGGKMFAEKPLETMEKGEFVAASATWTAQAGDRQLFLALVAPEGVKDIEESNNQLSLTVRGGGDNEPPTLVVSQPADKAELAGPQVTLAGTAKDNVALAGIEYCVDGGLWQPIDAKDRWQAVVPVSAGRHVFVIRARDTSGLEGSQTRTITMK